MKLLAAAAAVAVVVAIGATSAAASSPQDVANSISERVMSPFCPGVTLHDCPSDNAIQLRSQIATWASRGWSTQRIMAKLLAEYGPNIRAVPPDRGASLLVWLLPAIAVVLGAGTAGVLARRWTHKEPDPVAPAELAPQDRQRLEEELALVRNES